MGRSAPAPAASAGAAGERGPAPEDREHGLRGGQRVAGPARRRRGGRGRARAAAALPVHDQRVPHRRGAAGAPAQRRPRRGGGARPRRGGRGAQPPRRERRKLARRGAQSLCASLPRPARRPGRPALAVRAVQCSLSLPSPAPSLHAPRRRPGWRAAPPRSACAWPPWNTARRTRSTRPCYVRAPPKPRRGARRRRRRRLRRGRGPSRRTGRGWSTWRSPGTTWLCAGR